MDDVTYVSTCKSHPDKRLCVHSAGATLRASKVWDALIVLLSTKGHDFGKLPLNFGLKLDNKLPEGAYANHSYLSHVTMLMYYEQMGNDGVFKSFKDFIIVATCVMKHHGGLPNFDVIINVGEAHRLYTFLKTNPYYPVHEFMKLVDFDKNAKPLNLVPTLSSEKFVAKLKRNYIDNRILEKNIPTRYDRLHFYMELRMCFSALIYGDKGDAGDHDVSREDRDAIKFLKNYHKKIASYIKELSKRTPTPLNTLRSEMREVAGSNLRKILKNLPDQRTFLLTYPTGSGKTVIMLYLGGILHEVRGYKKIIYSIPFLSITEQIFDILEDHIFKGDKINIKRIDSKAAPDDDYDFEEIADSKIRKIFDAVRKIFKGKNLKEETIDRLLRQDYLESALNYSLIVTTFVKLFQAFTTASNVGLMKYSHLKNSIFLIDEFQALPPAMYTFFAALIDAFCKKFDSYAIFSTATMPHLEIPPTDANALDMFRDYKPPVEIGDEKYFSHPIFNRYKITTLTEKYTVATISSEIAKNKKSVLAVFNTVNDSEEVYRLLKSIPNCNIYLMNARFHPKSRRRILDKVKKHLSNNERVILVTTQLIEAGVDIDFNVVYRDIAPIPNIIQTFGRCNREGKLLFGEGYVFRLYDDDLTNLRARYIYNGENDRFYLDKSLNEVFFADPDKVITLEEKDLFSKQKNFFKNVSSNFRLGVWQKSTEDNRHEECNMVDQINCFKYGDMGAFRIIPEKSYGAQVQLYVATDENDTMFEKLHEYMAELAMAEVSTDGDRFRKIMEYRNLINNLTKDMRDNVVQVNISDKRDIPRYTDENYPSMICHLYKLKPGLYNEEFGLTIL